MNLFFRLSSITFFVAILFFMFKGKTFAFCQDDYFRTMTTSGNSAMFDITSSYINFDCSYHAEQLYVLFTTDTTATYTLEYSLDSGLSWHSQYSGATNSATMHFLSGSGAGDNRLLITQIDPSAIFPSNGSGSWHFNNANLQIKIINNDGLSWTPSFTSFSVFTILDNSEVLNSMDNNTTFATTNPVKVCDPLDLPCNLSNAFTNLLSYLFLPPNNFASDTFSTVKSQFDTKIPFAYIDTALGTDFSNTATSTAIPDFIMPFPTGTVLGQTIAIPQQTIHFPDNVHTAMGTIRSMLNYGLYAGLILYFITLAQRVI